MSFLDIKVEKPRELTFSWTEKRQQYENVNFSNIQTNVKLWNDQRNSLPDENHFSLASLRPNNHKQRGQGRRHRTVSTPLPQRNIVERSRVVSFDDAAHTVWESQWGSIPEDRAGDDIDTYIRDALRATNPQGRKRKNSNRRRRH